MNARGTFVVDTPADAQRAAELRRVKRLATLVLAAPLGLPIPHTAIIQSNQHRIADKLGEFIEQHFLEAAPVEAKLRQIDFGAFIADWLRDRKRSEGLARFALRLLAEAGAAAGNSGP